MKKIMSFVLTMSIMSGVSVVAMAKTPVVNHRQHEQQSRIRQGARSGELTGREAFKLQSQQAAIQLYEWKAKRDGHVSWKERYRLDNMQDRASHNIYKQKHDRQDR
ncbi:MAG: hypothetical protein AB1757_02555 [Acidobacteriota bacterium]